MEPKEIQQLIEKFPDRVAKFNVESFKISRETVKREQTGREEEAFFIQGLALPFGETSRNGVLYREKSARAKATSMIGNPALLNHDVNRLPIGAVPEFYPMSDGLHYKMEIDTEEKELIRKIEKGYIKSVSISCMITNPEFIEEKNKQFVAVDVDEFLELSVVTIAGFKQTTMQMVVESFQMGKKKENQEPESTEEDMKSRIEALENTVEELSNFKSEAENRIATVEARMDTFQEEAEDNDERDESADGDMEDDDSEDDDQNKKKDDESADDDDKKKKSESAEGDEPEEEEEEPSETEEENAEGDDDDPAKKFEKALEEEEPPEKKAVVGSNKGEEVLDLRKKNIEHKAY